MARMKRWDYADAITGKRACLLSKYMQSRIVMTEFGGGDCKAGAVIIE